MLYKEIPKLLAQMKQFLFLFLSLSLSLSLNYPEQVSWLFVSALLHHPGTKTSKEALLFLTVGFHIYSGHLISN